MLCHRTGKLMQPAESTLSGSFMDIHGEEGVCSISSFFSGGRYMNLLKEWNSNTFTTVIVSWHHFQMGAEDHLTTAVCFGYCVYGKGLEQCVTQAQCSGHIFNGWEWLRVPTASDWRWVCNIEKAISMYGASFSELRQDLQILASLQLFCTRLASNLAVLPLPYWLRIRGVLHHTWQEV